MKLITISAFGIGLALGFLLGVLQPEKCPGNVNKFAYSSLFSFNVDHFSVKEGEELADVIHSMCVLLPGSLNVSFSVADQELWHRRVSVFSAEDISFSELLSLVCDSCNCMFWTSTAGETEILIMEKGMLGIE